MYLNNKGITIDEMWEWIKKIFVINNFPYKNFKEGDFNMFANTNEIMRMFSFKNVQKMEDKLGKDWWKNDKDKKL